MKTKEALGLSLLAIACTAGHAQSPANSLSMYGIVDLGFNRVTGINGDAKQIVSGIMEGSRWGLRGNEDLGSGYRAVFTLESRLEADNGTWSNRPPSGSQVPDRLNNAALLGLPAPLQPAVSAVAAQIGSTIGVNLANSAWDRQVFVGLVTPFGGILAGRQYTPAYEVSAAFDALGTQSSLAAGQVATLPSGFDIRVSNALQYRIQTGGITAGAMYGFGEVAGNSKANRFGGLFGIYRRGAFAAGLGYNQRYNEVGEKSLRSIALGASALVGPGKVSALYGLIKDDNPSGVSTIAAGLAPVIGAGAAALVQGAFTNALKQDARLMHIGYKLENVPNTFYIAYSRYNDRLAANADVASYGVAYTYTLSKRTDLNMVLAHFDNKGLGQAAPGQAGFVGGVTRSAGTDANNVAFGIRHRF